MQLNSTLQFSPVPERTKLSQMVVERLKAALVEGALHPGDQLPCVTQLASDMNVGTSSVREAIKMLEALGVVEAVQGKGVFVCKSLNENAMNPLSMQLLVLERSVQDLVQFREMFETAFTLLAMKQVTAEDLDKMEQIVCKLEQKTKYEGADSADEMEFHRSVLNCTHNPYVIRSGEAMLEVFLATIPTCGKMSDDSGIAKDHRMIFESLRDKDEARLMKVLKKSFDGWRVRLNGKQYVEETSRKD